ncbi:MAG: metallophosphoesterase [Bacteroidota bacterium]
MKTLKLLKIWLFIISILFISIELDAQEGTVIFEEDFDESYLTGWEVINEVDGEANWYLDEDYLVQDSNIGSGDQRGTNLIKSDLVLDNFTLRAKFNSTDDDYSGVVFRYTNSDNYYKFVLSSQRSLIQLQKRVNGTMTILDSYTATEWPFVGFTVTIAAYNNDIKVYLNDELYLEALDNEFASGSFGLMSCYNNGNFFDWIKIYDSFQLPEVDDRISISRGPYIQNLTDSSVAILWGTNKNSLGLLEIGLDSTSYQSIDENISTSNHQISTSQLLEETKYYYRVKSGDTYSKWESFTTFAKNPDSFSFIVYGDTRTNFLRHNEVASNFADHEFDFIVHTGDPVQRGLRNDWNVEFFNPIKRYIKEKPLYVAIGNHELNAQNFYDYFEFPNSEHENYYSFTLGNTFFVFIDNNRARYIDDIRFPSIKPDSPQYIWIEEQLSSTEATEADWIFVFSHIPIFYGGDFNTYPDCKDYLLPLFEKYSVDFSFVGHVHGYERGFRNNINYVLTGGGGGTGPVKDDGYIDPGYPQTEYPFREIYNYCKMEVNGDEATLSAYDIFGEEIDSKVITATSVKNNKDENTILRTELFNAYPNPFNPTTEISYAISRSSDVTLKVYNVLGQSVSTLVNQEQPQGSYKIKFNASNIPSGVYYYRIEAGSFVQTKKILLIK